MTALWTLLLALLAMERADARLEGDSALSWHRVLPGKPPEECGNGRCKGDETCDSCPGDCGSCPATCGNRIIEGSELCDYDANNINGVPAINGQCNPDPSGTCTTGDDFVRFLGCNLDCACPSLPTQGSEVDLRIEHLEWAGSGGGTCKSEAKPGDVCVIDYTVKNYGVDKVYGRTDCRSWRTCFYLLSSETEDCGGSTSVLLGCSVQNALAPYCTEASCYPSDQHRGNPAFSIPAVSRGQYSLCAVADEGMDVQETEETNNSRTNLKSILIH